MSTSTVMSLIDEIGETAGQVWHSLDKRGPMSLPMLVKEVDAPRDLVMQAVGWLAREDKVWIEEESRRRIVSLREES